MLEDKLYPIKLIEKQFEDRISTIFPTLQGNWIINFKQQSKILKLDKNLSIIWERDDKAVNKSYCTWHVIESPNEKFTATSRDDRFKIWNENGKSIFTYKHKKWQNFSGSQNLFTSDNQYFINILPTEDVWSDVLQLRNIENFGVVNEIALNWGYSSYRFYATSSPNHVILSAACGQDDGMIFNVFIDNSKLKVERWKDSEDLVPGNLSSNKTRLITAPHYGDEVAEYDVFNQEKIRSLKWHYLFNESEDGFGYQVEYIGETSVLVMTQEGKLLFIDMGKGTSKELLFQEEVIDFHRTFDSNILAYHSKKIALYKIWNDVPHGAKAGPNQLSLF